MKPHFPKRKPLAAAEAKDLDSLRRPGVWPAGSVGGSMVGFADGGYLRSFFFFPQDSSNET